MERPNCQQSCRPAEPRATVPFGHFCLRLVCLVLVGLWIMVQMPGWAPGPEAATISSPVSSHLAASEAERFDTPAGAEQRLKLKAMIACESGITKDPDWHPPDVTAVGTASLYAGTRGSAGIPADRIRLTAVARPLPYHLRAPPARG